MNFSKRFNALLVIILIFPSAALAHSDREPGVIGWVMHQYSVHTFEVAIVVALVLYVAGFVLYRLMLEPDFEKEARKRKKKGDGCTPGGTGGCSGCGGCGGCS